MAVRIFGNNKMIATVGLANKPQDYDNIDINQVTTLMSGIWNRIERANYRNKLEVEKNKCFSTSISIGDGFMIIGLDEKIEMINTADFFRTYLRSEDIAARWGGEEFAVFNA